MVRVLLLLSSVLSGCALLPSSSATPAVLREALHQRFEPHCYTAGHFQLATFARGKSATDLPLHVYIEGDGHSWATRYRLSSDPTPHTPLTLQFAIHDPHPHVLYVARPGQFQSPVTCPPRYWSTHRYAPEVIEAYHLLFNQLKQRQPSLRFRLIGFSGGAAIAVLLASQRQDIEGLITIAGNLDHEALTHHHQTTPLTGSLNPYQVASLLKDLPQQHWIGSHDRVVPPTLALQFVEAVGDRSCAQAFVVPNVGHHKGWLPLWPQILKTPLRCH